MATATQQDKVLAEMFQASQRRLAADMAERQAILARASGHPLEPTTIDISALDDDLRASFNSGAGFAAIQNVVLQLQAIRLLREIAKSLAEIQEPPVVVTP